MKNLIAALLPIFLASLCLGQPVDLAGTTVIVVRHAEKVDSSHDPDLNEAGRNRAIRLSELLKGADVAALYSSQFKRTKQTLAPLAERFQLEIQAVEAAQSGDLARRITTGYPGKTVVVASHSDRVTEIIEALGGPSVGFLEETDYDNVFVVTLLDNSTADVLRLKY
jgi:broad specificity phosphatase PhoE